jgi:hypothetical protein
LSLVTSVPSTSASNNLMSFLLMQIRSDVRMNAIQP